MWFNFNKINSLVKDFYLYKNELRIYVHPKGNLSLNVLDDFIIRNETKIDKIRIYNPDFIEHKLQFDKPVIEAPIIF